MENEIAIYNETDLLKARKIRQRKDNILTTSLFLLSLSRKLTEVIKMAQTLVNFRMDEELKQNMEQTCQELGMNMTTAFTIFAKKMTREKRIPFEVSVDPFYSDSNMNYLKKVISEIDSGKAKLREHELIED